MSKEIPPPSWTVAILTVPIPVSKGRTVTVCLPRGLDGIDYDKVFRVLRAYARAEVGPHYDKENVS